MGSISHLSTEFFKDNVKTDLSKDAEYGIVPCQMAPNLSELALKNLLTQKYEFFISNDKTNLSASVLVNITRVADIVVLPVLQTISGSFVIFFISCAILFIAKSTALFLILGLLLGYLFILRWPELRFIKFSYY